jgi:Mn-dependent DtxR family transcriptional regulator
MSDYIRIPNSILKLTERCKHEEALVYAIIRSQIKDNSLKASIPQEQIAAIINMTERTVSSYVSDLKVSGLLKVAERKQGESGHPHNVYQFDELKKDYFMILPPLLYDSTISAKLKGLLLFIKGSCWKGTNYLCYNGKTTDLATTLKVGRNQIKGYLAELCAKGYIRYIGKSIHIINENFLLFWDQDVDNITYKIIYDFCLEHDRVPPIKRVDGRGKDKTLSWIVGAYTDDFERLRDALNERCKNLPENLSLEYFCQVLRNKKPTRDGKTCKPDIRI